jgi:hypothetical protein
MARRGTIGEGIVSVITLDCNECNHSDVCGIKDKYEQFKKSAGYVSASSGKCIHYASDCEDVTIEVKCNHFQKVVERPRGL